MNELHPNFTIHLDEFPNWLNKVNDPERRISVNDFFGIGIGKAESLKRILAKELISQNDLSNDKDLKDFSGLYVFYSNGIPQYVGISRGVVNRIHQHIKGKNHFSASWAFRLLRETIDEDGARAIITTKFKEEFEESKQRIMKMSVSVLPINNPYQLYLFEVYCALVLETNKYNSFRTH